MVWVLFFCIILLSNLFLVILRCAILCVVPVCLLPVCMGFCISYVDIYMNKDNISSHLSGMTVLAPFKSCEPIVVSLEWRCGKGGLWGMFRRRIDLDLGCFYRLRDGRVMVIDALQFGGGYGGGCDVASRQGCLVAAPYVWHHGDDMGVGERPSECISIGCEALGVVEDVTFYVFTSMDTVRLDEVKPCIRVLLPDGAEYVHEVSGRSHGLPFYVGFNMHFTAGGIEFSIIDKYYRGHIGAGDDLGWGVEFE